jgi:hypothetical protein
MLELILKASDDVIRYNNSKKKELLEQLEQYKHTIKQLKAGCDKLEQAVMKGDILLIF